MASKDGKSHCDDSQDGVRSSVCSQKMLRACLHGPSEKVMVNSIVQPGSTLSTMLPTHDPYQVEHKKTLIGSDHP